MKWLVMPLTLAAAPLAAQPSKAPSLRWSSACPVAAPPNARCGEMTVPENRERSTGRDVVVPFVIVSAPDQKKKPPEPFLFLMGGQGAGLSAMRYLGPIAAVLNRDVIAVEQRGNPLARPFHGCASVPGYSLLHHIWVSIPSSKPADIDACKAELRRNKVDLNSYNTLAAAQDLADLRRLLQISAWNVYGVSYGARVGSTLLRVDPAPIRALILDSFMAGNLFGWDRILTMGAYFDRCTATPECAQVNPDLKGQLEKVVTELERSPAKVIVNGRQETIGPIEFINLINGALYSQEFDLPSRIPAAIKAAANGNFGLALSLGGFYTDREPSSRRPLPGEYPEYLKGHISQQVGFACAEDYQHVSKKGEWSLVSAPFPAGWAPAVRRAAEAEQRRQIAVCRRWGFGRTNAILTGAPSGDAPTLILAGEHDVVSPPVQAKVAARSLRNAQLLIFPWTGHAMSSARPVCTFGLIGQFLADPRAKVDASCVSAIKTPYWPKADVAGRLPPAELIKATVENEVRAGGIPARAGLVDAPSVGLHALVAAGAARSDRATPLTGKEPFRIASQTKTFTAAAILRLHEDGGLGLDDPISRHLSAESLSVLRRGGYEVDAITVRHLLTHNSGIYDFAADPAYREAVFAQPTKRWTRVEQTRWAVDHGRPAGKPGERYHYSDTGYGLLGEIIERRSGLPQARAYRELLNFSSLGLASTWFESLEPEPAGIGPRAEQYVGGQPTSASDPSFDLYGGGGLVSTMEDLALFYRGLWRGGVFKRPDTLATMLNVPATNVGAADGADYASGIYATSIDGVRCWAHAGFWGSATAYCPDVDVTIGANRYSADAPPNYDGSKLPATAMETLRLRRTSPSSFTRIAR